MPATADLHLWTHVARGVIPLGAPCPGPRRFRDVAPRVRHVDLHGDTVQAAYERVGETLDAAQAAGGRDLVVVTGRSGMIRVEFACWAARHPAVMSLDPLPGGGAFRVRLRAAR